jgi:protein-S-isoprenylcysteine O-methyltransferase Ste14
MKLLLRTLLFTLLYPGTVAGWVPWLLTRGAEPIEPSLSGWPVLSLAFLTLGLGMYGWCVWDFITQGSGTPAPYDPPQQLVATGLYRWVRNPMYEGVLLVLIGETLLYRSRALALYTIFLFLAFHLRVLWYEEPTLRRSFGESYEQYCRSVNRWIPRFGRRGRR